MSLRPHASASAADRPDLMSRAVEWGILALVVLSPLPAASVQAWAILAIQLAVLSLAVLHILTPGRGLVNERLRKALEWPRVMALAFFSWIAFELIPLPPFLLRILSPNALALNAQYGLSSSASRFLGLSLVPSETVKAASALLAYFLLGFLVLRTFTSAKQIRRLITVIIAMGVLEALYGMFELYRQSPRILFYLKPSSLDSVSGTFVNRNHFAGYLEMIIPLVMGLIVARAGLFSLSGLSWRRKFVAVTEKGLLVNLLLGLMTVVMAVAVVFSHSRSGIATMALTFVFFFGFAALFKEKDSERKRLIRRFINGMFVLVILLSVMIGIRSTVQRFSPDRVLHEGRSIIWSQTIHWIGRFPVFGTGLGTFASLNPGSEVEGTLISFDHAHNEYLEYLMEVGTVGAALLLSLILTMLGLSIAAWRSRTDPEVRGLALGGIVSCLSVLFHSVTDFSTHIPANAVLFSVVLSATMAVAFLKRKPGRPLAS
ncbi:MAG: O-antigen ligase family protein [Candidatus Aminicenantales bacterium]